MNARQLENWIVFLIVLVFGFVIWMILYRPQWLLWLFTIRG